MSTHRLIPSFITRRVRWVWLAGLTSAVWMNRRDAARWLRFATRSIQQRRTFDLHSWLTEARLRAAVTTDPVLRSDPDFDDLEVSDGHVTVRTSGAANWDAGTHLDALRRVKGVTQVACLPRTEAPIVDSVTANPSGNGTIHHAHATVPLDKMDSTFD